jgi:glucosylceramidase
MTAHRTTRSTHPKLIAAHASAAAPVVSRIRQYTTSANKRLGYVADLFWQTGQKATPGHTIVLMPEMTFQNILGFGACLTDSSCYNFSLMSEESRGKLFHKLFSPDEAALNVNRMTVGPSDYSPEIYNNGGPGPDPKMKHFNLRWDRQYKIPMIKQALSFNPDGMFLFGSPWSPLPWMTSNGTMTGGTMERAHMQTYALFLLKWLQGYMKAGIKVQGLTVQNEPDTNQGGAMVQCSWPQEFWVDFIKSCLGPLLEKMGMKTEIWIIDHNPNLWGMALAALDDYDLRRFITGVAWHWYNNDPGRMSQVHDAYPDKTAHWTEGGQDITNPDYKFAWARWAKSFTTLLRNRCSSLTAWNMALDENGKPNIGPFPCAGLVTIDSKTHEVTYSGLYHAMVHFSKFVRRGATVIESLSGLGDVSHVALKNPDGSFVAVITNNGEAQTISVQLGENSFDLGLEKDSVTTLVW